MKNKIKNIFKIIGCSSLAVLIALSCVIIPKKLSKNQRFLGTSLNCANAATDTPIIPDIDATFYDSVFYSSDVIFARLGNSNSSNINNFSQLINTAPDFGFTYIPQAFLYSFRIGINENSLSVSIRGSMGTGSYVYRGTNQGATFYEIFNNDYSSIGSNLNVSDMRTFIIYDAQILDYTAFAVSTHLKHNDSNEDNIVNDGEVTFFTNKYVSVEIFNYTEFSYYCPDIEFDNAFSYSNIVKYTDTAGNYILIYIPNIFPYNNVNAGCYYTYRKYYLRYAFDFSDNSYYQQGLNDGYSVGYNNGSQNGYTDGYNAGEKSGYTDGYNAGLNTADSATFYNLIGAVFDAPLNTFTSLFNFNILGVNLLSFLSSILTLAIVIWLIKIALGGK